MQFFIYGRDRPGAGSTRRALLKDHWAFMRTYIPMMIARGPTMSADGGSVTGSMHIVDLPDADAARDFAQADPLAKGGVFEAIAVHRFRNALGRTMWDFRGDASNARFLFIGEGGGISAMQRESLAAAQHAFFSHASRAERVIVYGPLLAAHGETWQGTAVLLETADRAAAESLVHRDPAAKAGLYARSELLPWRFGGEENLRDLVGAP